MILFYYCHKSKKVVLSLLNDFLDLLVPRLCPACGRAMIKSEGIMCMHCLYDLPKTRFTDFRDNAVARLFWGRVWLANATSLFHFQKGSRYQGLIHQLKYAGRTDIGVEMGKVMGRELRASPFAEADLILPVPLHPRRQRRRGYNQCDFIAQGVSSSMGIPVITGLISRSSASLSQTDKSRIERWGNVEQIFRVNTPGKLENRHILLVDDVVTTGATLDACATVILNLDGTKVSIATLAFTGKLF